MANRFFPTSSYILATLFLLLIVACVQPTTETLIPTSPFSQSFAPFEVISSVATREGLSDAIRMRGGGCSESTARSPGGPTVTHMTCRGEVEVHAREDAARLTRAVFKELEGAARAHAKSEGLYKGSSPESRERLQELHLGYCSDDRPLQTEPGVRDCLFLHFFAIEGSNGPKCKHITYLFTLDEERTIQPGAANSPAGS